MDSEKKTATFENEDNQDPEVIQTLEEDQTFGGQSGDLEAEDSGEKEATNGWLEKFYDNFSGVPLKYLDAFILICVAALILVVLVGVLKAKHVI